MAMAIICFPGMGPNDIDEVQSCWNLDQVRRNHGKTCIPKRVLFMPILTSGRMIWTFILGFNLCFNFSLNVLIFQFMFWFLFMFWFFNLCFDFNDYKDHIIINYHLSTNVWKKNKMQKLKKQYRHTKENKFVLL